MDPATIVEMLKTNGLATVLVLLALPWIARRVDRLIARFEKHLDAMDGMQPDVKQIKEQGCAHRPTIPLRPSPSSSISQPAQQT